ncbi:MAG: hypothetical protein ABJA67_02550 [Chthonomonadales bacterium]
MPTLFALIFSLCAIAGLATITTKDEPYKVLKTAKVGGDGGFDYVYADSVDRKVYIARGGAAARINVFNLDTLATEGEITNTNARGAAADDKYHHGFASSSPVAMWDTKTLKPIKTIPVQGRPDGILADSFNHRVYVFSHSAPNVTVIDANSGDVLGTIDLDGAPEQATTDGKGHIYVDIEDKDSVGVIDANTMKVTAKYSLNGKGGGNAGLALDVKNHILFVACRTPQVMVMMDANDGKVLGTAPIGRGCDGAGFSAKSGECFSSQGDGTLTIIKKSKDTFDVTQTVKTMPGAKTMTIDTKTGNVLLIAAEYGPPPTGAVPGGRNRGALVPGSFSIIVVGK